MKCLKTSSFLKIFSLSISLTPGELNWAEWAIDPMWEYWCTEEGAWERGEDTIFEESELPKLNGSILILSDIPEINEDLLYRTEEQSYNVCQTDAISEQQVSARYRSANSLSQKIRQMLGI